MTTKKALRLAIKKATDALSSSYLNLQSQMVAKTLRQCSFYRSANTIAFYMSMDKGEIQTIDMIHMAFQDGKRVFLPHIVKYKPEEEHPWFPSQKTHLQMLEVSNYNAVLELKPQGAYQIREPTSGLDCLSPEGPGLDLIVLPGVAFSKNCGRLGHGAGFYDSFINEHEHVKSRIPKLVGVGLREQLVASDEDLPMADHDRRLDAVIIDESTYTVADR